jgi:tetratricopeptide (TPR) repeat protein
MTICGEEKGSGMRAVALAGLLLASVSGAAMAQQVAQQQVAQQPGTPAKQTVQQAFDAATALSDKGEDAAALAAWEALEVRTRTNPRSLAIVRLRKSQVLLRLRRRDEAAEAARAGLKALSADDATLREDRALGYLSLGLIAENGLDYGSAVEAYRNALALSITTGQKLSAMRGLIATETFLDGKAALAELAPAEALIADPAVDKRSKATIKATISLAYLNQGQYKEAQRTAGEAVTLLGGLSVKTDLSDVAARSDYALAALKLGDKDEARRYIAYTGAGRSPETFEIPAELDLPPCGGEAELLRDDVAIIEFSVEDDGSVQYSVPIYGSRPGPMAIEFARAARGWSWSIEKLKKLPPFFRRNVRIEMRCSTELQRPSIGNYLAAARTEWLAAKGIVTPEDGSGSDALRLSRLRAALTARDAKGGSDTLADMPLFVGIAYNAVSGREETNAVARRALAVLVANGAPPLVRLSVETTVWATQASDRRNSISYGQQLRQALQNSVYSADSDSVATLSLLLADADWSDKNVSDKLSLLQAVGRDPRLDSHHPLKVGALVRLASLEYRKGDVTAARKAFDDSGLSGDQCALLDAKPVPLPASTRNLQFPRDAQMWGFEGWTKVQLDVDAKGKTLNVRTVVAYPPFVFSDSATQMFEHLQFSPTYRPGKELGCGGLSSSLRFSQP